MGTRNNQRIRQTRAWAVIINGEVGFRFGIERQHERRRTDPGLARLRRVAEENNGRVGEIIIEEVE